MTDIDPTASLAAGSEADEHAKKAWYVIHVYSSMEKSVQRLLQERIEQSGMTGQFSRILVPSEEVVEVKDGREIVTERRFFPGYVLLEMQMTDEAWHFVNATKGVMGFVGGSSRKGSAGGARKVASGAGRPSPIPQAEIDQILSRIEGKVAPRPKTLFNVGEMVRIKSEPFADFNGSIEEVNYEKSRLRVLVMIFGRATPVDLEFGQVEKLSEYS